MLIETVFGYDTIFREVKINVHSRAENISTRKKTIAENCENAHFYRQILIFWTYFIARAGV